MINPDDELNKLQQAKEKENKAIKLLVLKMLHLSDIMAVDASESVLDKETEQAIAPAPTENWN